MKQVFVLLIASTLLATSCGSSAELHDSSKPAIYRADGGKGHKTEVKAKPVVTPKVNPELPPPTQPEVK